MSSSPNMTTDCVSSKQCHIKNFGTRDLRHANLPDRNEVFASPPTSPSRPATYLPQSGTPPPRNTAPALPPRTMSPPIFRPTRALSPTRAAGAERTISAAAELQTVANGAVNAADEDDWDPPVIHNTPSHAGRSAGGLPRTVALDSSMTGPPRAASPLKEPPSPVRARPMSTGSSVGYASAAQESPALGGRMTIPLTPTRTGPRYGGVLGARTGSPITPASTGRTWGSPGGNPACGKCGKTVYFAEQVRNRQLSCNADANCGSQVKAIGKTWHKNCLRCTECNKLLDSTRLTENEGNPFCNHCYGKVCALLSSFSALSDYRAQLYGPAGSGYALLGKAGG